MIEIKNLKYKNILNIDYLRLPDCGFIMIKGESGAGKSTLLHLIGSILKPSDGTIKYNNKSIYDNITYLNVYRKNEVGFCFQDNNLFDNMTVEENLSIYENCENEINNYLKIFDLTKYKRTKIVNLSSGERKLIAIIRALVKKPRVLLIDEPFEVLDYDNRIILLELLKKTANNVLVIISTHKTEEASSYIDREIVLHDGKIESENIIHEEFVENTFVQNNILNKNFINKVSINYLKINKVNFFISILLLSICLSLLLISYCTNFDFPKILLDTLNHENINKIYTINVVSFDTDRKNIDVARYFYKSLPEDFYYNTMSNSDISSYYYLAKPPIVFSHLNTYIEEQLEYGKIPTEKDEIIMSSYSFDLAKKYGLKSLTGNMYIPQKYEDIINKQFLYNDIPIKIVGIYKTNEKDYYDLKKDYDYTSLNTILNKTTYKRLIFFDDIDSTIYVNKDFDNYMTENGFSTYLTNYYYIALNNNEINDYIEKANNINPNFWDLIINNNFISLYGTKYATATGYALTTPFILISIMKVLVPVWILLSIFIIFYYIRSLYIGNNKNISVLFSIGFEKKDISKLILNTVTIYIISGFGIALVLSAISYYVLNNLLTSVVGFYLKPFHLDFYTLFMAVLAILTVFMISWILLKISYIKRNELKYLKNN